MSEPIAIVFYPEGEPVPAAILAWQARNADWRLSVDKGIECPVCGLSAVAIADHALLDDAAIDEAIHRYRERYLRGACSDHYYPTLEDWAVRESMRRGRDR